MNYFDSHCHLDLEPLSQELETVVERAYKAGVTGMINIGTSLRGSSRSVEIANMYPNVWATVGLHPQDVGEVNNLENIINELKYLAKSDKVVAIGEIGLDYYSAGTGEKGNISKVDKKNQNELFEAQLLLAKKLDLPVVIHSRDADSDILFLLKKTGVNRGVIHCFTGDENYANKILELGLYVGFTGFITFDQGKFEHIRQAVKIVPLEKILIETDAPFLAPEPHRGKTNEPAYVVEVAKKIAELKNLQEEDVANKTFGNTCKLFGLT